MAACCFQYQASEREVEGKEVSESHSSDQGCWAALAAFILAILVVYMIIDLIADREDARYIKDLQQRVSVLEAKK